MKQMIHTIFVCLVFILAFEIATVDATVIVEFLFKFGSFGSDNGQFNDSSGIAVDSLGNIYVVDSGNHRIQKFDPAGNFLLAWGSFGSGNGQFNSAYEVAVDSLDNIYVTDRQNHRIQKLDPTGNFLLTQGSLGSNDGQFIQPHGVAIDGSDNIYVVDRGNHRIQKFDTAGNFLDKFGSLCQFPDGPTCADPDGAGPLELGDGQFNFPVSIAVDSSGNNIYVTDTDNFRIQAFVVQAVPEPSTWLSLTIGGLVLLDLRWGTQRQVGKNWCTPQGCKGCPRHSPVRLGGAGVGEEMV